MSHFVNAIVCWCQSDSIDLFVDSIIFNVKVIADCIKEYIEIKILSYLKHEFDYFNQTIHAQFCEKKLNNAIDKAIQEFVSLVPPNKNLFANADEIFDLIEVNKKMKALLRFYAYTYFELFYLHYSIFIIYEL